MDETKYIICDLDGTLFDVSHRLPLLKNCRDEKDYDKFHSMHIEDKINDKVMGLLGICYGYYYKFSDYIKIIYITGRHEKFRKSTIKQLKKEGLNEFEPIPTQPKFKLYMKPSYEIYTPDFVKDTLKTIFGIYGKENCLFVLDDRPTTIKIYRDTGLLCLQVQNSTGFLEDVNKNK